MTFVLPLILLTSCECFDNPPAAIHMAAFKGNMSAVKKFIEYEGGPEICVMVQKKSFAPSKMR